ncbi:CDP-glycerol glycerophosphotransferase family protein|uniref:CDP-glycerol glycerophosphotransferase n=1 Tax=Dendrosporobacter quercicolus TaxID=146817 RepID=A0A1G9YIF6_9FIRM|nr:CDP-glycerol glycerophosphotransferase family protein [Dendrosporobacter quercicolus]NSL47651.1 CDP-glycerol glycerophosphotransferase family protein [Dendrosporobacter quercicolus DSM 1736]SDN08285.1 CDP-glycerol glycerophosphotransferase [Dendrosporobacter quercicolus]
MSLKNYKILLTKLLEKTLYFILGWGLIIPLACIIPKKKNLLLFKASGNNVKYLYFYACRQPAGLEFYYLTRNKKLIQQLKTRHLPVLPYPSWRTLFKMFQASAYIIDNHISPLNYYIFYRARKIQLWHGIGVKQIGPSSVREIKSMKEGRGKELAKKLVFNPTYDVFLSTSDFYTREVFSPAIKAGQFWDFGYPRNDLLFTGTTIDEQLLDTDSEKNKIIRDFKQRGHQAVLYAPTFRDTGGDPVSDLAIELPALNDFARSHHLLFVFKFHPTTRVKGLINSLSNCIEYDKGRDIYPVMSCFDLLITDYSSIYLDFLLLNRPVLFFPYDYEKYRSRDRDIEVGYDWITPGPKCYTQQELEEQMIRLLIRRSDGYQQQRREILTMAFTYQDGNASERVLSAIKNLLTEKSSLPELRAQYNDFSIKGR